jgi:hypothetical protein
VSNSKYTEEEKSAIRGAWSLTALAFVGVLSIKAFNYAASVERLEDVLNQCEDRGLAQETLYNTMFYAQSRNGEPNSGIIVHNQMQAQKGHWYSNDDHYECKITKNYIGDQPFNIFVERR